MRVRNLLPQRRTVTLDALPGKERPGRPLPDGKIHPGGFDYETVTFGPHRAQGHRGPRRTALPDIIDLPKGAEASSAIETGIAQGTFRMMPDAPGGKKKK